jgi:hypothetical protein
MVSGLAGIFGGIYGALWSIGWELGKNYGPSKWFTPKPRYSKIIDSFGIPSKIEVLAIKSPAFNYVKNRKHYLPLLL